MTKFYVIIFLTLAAFLATGNLVLKLRAQPVMEKHKELYLPLHIKGWEGRELTLNDATVNVIRPDNYLFRDYRRNGENLNLYVGYYGSLKKSDAAHIPSLCYPAQGWQILEKTDVITAVNGRNLRFSRLKVKKGSAYELVYYGFRNARMTTGSLISLRTDLVKSMVMGKETENAFIRFSTPVTSGGIVVAEGTLKEFIGETSPFIDEIFVKSGGDDGKPANL